MLPSPPLVRIATHGLEPVEAVVFDLDNTLVNRQRALARWLLDQLRALRAAHGLPPADRQNRRRWVHEIIAWDRWGARDHKQLANRLVSTALDSILSPRQQAERAEQLAGGIRELPNHVRPDARVQQLLAQLAGQKFRLAVASNGSSDLQRRKLQAAGLAEFPWDAVAISGELGIAKPARQLFERVASALRTRPNRILMVGDDWRRDVLGARDAGWQSCWVTWGRTPPRETPAVWQVERTTDLLHHPALRRQLDQHRSGSHPECVEARHA
ncbi:MAG: HAD family hydrolase [Planctomycetales bacterium]|nr:HAD family hydrolase [Planctomycetales bacterium]